MNRWYLSFLLMLLLVIPTAVLADTPAENPAAPNTTTPTIGLIPSGSASPFHLELIEAVKAAAGQKNETVIVLMPDAETNISFQESAMNQLIHDHVDIICLNTLNTKALDDEILAAQSEGIPVILYNTLVAAEGANATGYIGYNQYTGAREMGIYAARTLAGMKHTTVANVTGRAFILRGLPGFHADQRTAGFVAGLSGSPGIEIVGQEVAGWDRDTARTIASTALALDPSIDIFYGNSDEMAIGAALAATDAGKKVNSDILCLGIDGNVPTLEMIQNGTMTATLGVYPDRMGRTIVSQADRVLTGETIQVFLETPSVVVDAGTVDAYLNGSTWTEPVAGNPEVLATTA